MLWKITYSEEICPRKQWLSWKVIYPEEVADKKSNCYQKVEIRKKIAVPGN